MAGYNKVILIGNLTRDPVAGTIPQSGTSVCDFSLAMNRRWKDGNGNEREEVLFMARPLGAGRATPEQGPRRGGAVPLRRRPPQGGTCGSGRVARYGRPSVTAP